MSEHPLLHWPDLTLEQLNELRAWLEPWMRTKHMTVEANPSGLQATDGTTTISPTTELSIGSGLTLTNPSGSISGLATTKYAAQWEVIGDNAPTTIGGAGVGVNIPLKHLAGVSLMDFTVPTLPTFKTPGLYMVTANPALQSGAASGVLEVRLSTSETFGSMQWFALVSLVTGGSFNPETVLTVPAHPRTTADNFQMSLKQNSGGNLTTNDQLMVQRIE